MLNFALRWGVLALAALFAAMSWSSWRTGEPPPGSILAPRIDAQVIDSRVDSGLTSNGTMRHRPVVTINTVNGAQELAGLQPSFFAYRQKHAERIAADYRAGESVRVRQVNGVLMADRIDLFQTAHAIFMSLMTLIIAAIGVVLAFAMKSARKLPSG